jgi:ParB-like chromosome segregation protein Spo0J
MVEPAGERFRLVAGARRHAAATKAGLAELPAMVRGFEGAGQRDRGLT